MARLVARVAGAALSLAVLGSGAQAAEKVKLTFLWPTYTPSKVRYGEELVKQFEEANPDIDVDLQLVPDPYAKLKVMVAGGAPPDVVWLGAAWHQFAPLFLPLEDLVRRDAGQIGMNDFLKPVWDAHVWNGHRYALPSGYQTLATSYNQNRYNEAGLSYPNDNWTVADMLGDAKALTRDTNGDNKPDQWGVSWLYGYYWSFVHYGGQVANEDWTKIRINNPVTAKALALWNDLPYRHEVAPPDHGTLKMIENGDIAIFASGIWLQESLQKTNNFAFDLVDYPWLEMNNGRYRGTIIYPEEFAILNTSKHKEQAWRFLKFATGRQHLTWAAREGHIVPARRSILQSDVFMKPGKRMQVWFTSVDYAMQLMPHPAYNELMAAFTEYWGKMSGPSPQMTIDAGLELIAKRMQVVLDDYNARNRGK